jgi:NhaP-type Na+/H+ or K+/H+ antiporter
VFVGGTYLYFNVIAKDEVKAINGATGEESILQLNMHEILLMGALLCSTDTVAAISLLDPIETPKLFSVVFGEGVVNDGVVIILFNAVNAFFAEGTDGHSDPNSGFSMSDAGNLLVDFVSLGVMSLLWGIFCGFSCAYMLKRWVVFMAAHPEDKRDENNKLIKSEEHEEADHVISPVSECSIIFCFSYFSYVSSELLALSGIISLLTCAIIMAKYAWFNLSSQGRNASVVIFEFLGLLATGFVFSYLGLTFFFYQDFMWSQ